MFNNNIPHKSSIYRWALIFLTTTIAIFHLLTLSAADNNMNYATAMTLPPGTMREMFKAHLCQQIIQDKPENTFELVPDYSPATHQWFAAIERTLPDTLNYIPEQTDTVIISDIEYNNIHDQQSWHRRMHAGQIIALLLGGFYLVTKYAATSMNDQSFIRYCLIADIMAICWSAHQIRKSKKSTATLSNLRKRLHHVPD